MVPAKRHTNDISYFNNTVFVAVNTRLPTLYFATIERSAPHSVIRDYWTLGSPLCHSWLLNAWLPTLCLSWHWIPWDIILNCRNSIYLLLHHVILTLCFGTVVQPILNTKSKFYPLSAANLSFTCSHCSTLFFSLLCVCHYHFIASHFWMWFIFRLNSLIWLAWRRVCHVSYVLIIKNCYFAVIALVLKLNCKLINGLKKSTQSFLNDPIHEGGQIIMNDHD